MTTILQILIFISIIIGIIAYLPQIQLLLKRKSSADISLNSWYLWLFTTIVYFAEAWRVKSMGLIVAQFTQLTLITVIIFLVYKYRKKKI